ncbi:hypothetical protein ACLOJK_007167, partial [Asimina triloba]
MAPSIFLSIIIWPSKHPKQLVVASRHSIGQIYAIHQVHEVEAVSKLPRLHPTVAGRPIARCHPRQHHLACFIDNDYPPLSTTPRRPPLHVGNNK